MKLLPALLATFLLAASMNAAEVIRAGRWDLHNSLWMSLHQTLMQHASARTPPDLAALTPQQRTAWTAAVNAYREAAGSGSITFSEAMMGLQDQLSQVADDAANPAITSPLGAAIRQAAPVYRAQWWPADQAANRFFIGYTAAMLRDAGEEIARGHEVVYGRPLPERIRVDVAPFGGTFGAYTHTLQHAGTIVTISSRDSGYHGLAALEGVLHESSHSIVFPRYGDVARAISAAAARRGIPPPPDLWHAVLFATTSELTRRALQKRGVADYVPFSKDLLTRAWPQYREAIETHWIPYVSGTGTMEEAIEKIVTSLR
jgi:hypothetical protein